VPGVDESLVHGKRRFNFVWYRPAAVGEALSTLLTDETGTRHELSIPPNLIRADVIASMRSDADRLLAPQFAEVIHRTSHPFLQAIVDLEAPRMKLGARIAILGDAAFVARPHVGMGVTKAAGDAAVLVEALAKHPDDIAEALSAYERERLVVGTTIIHRARQLGAYMQAQILTTDERQSAELCCSSQAVMSETAIGDLPLIGMTDRLRQHAADAPRAGGRRDQYRAGGVFGAAGQAAAIGRAHRPYPGPSCC
jgi:2-polyprenyl-6-methoxyphenol hydroxylase-like FAD-dependent oxidoreductase